jgi:glycosyltransferase involved in cell wall biosynthesis
VTDAPRILCVHPNGELYGSDRTFLQAVRAFRERWPAASITILLPVEGSLAAALRAIENDVRVVPLMVLRRAKPIQSLFGLAALPAKIWRARRMMNAHDLTYINTVVILDFLLASHWVRTGRIVHVHELPTGRTGVVFSQFLKWSRAYFIFISNAVREAFPDLRGAESAVIWNGTRDLAIAPSTAETLNILLIGRFNAWKGQPVLLEAIARITPQQRENLRVRLVGSVFKGQEVFETNIRDSIARLDLGDCVEVFGFDPTPDKHYEWANLVVVPSTSPEPFGLVAIEAMSAGRAVIAANHGGLAEIVVDGTTGTLVSPGDARDLASAIEIYLENGDIVRRHGQAGRARYEAEFRETTHMERIANTAADIIKSSRSGARSTGEPT